MRELVTDFVRNGGTYMVVTALEGMHSGQISRVQQAMLSSVNIPNLLRVDVREIDFEVSIHYEITGKRMLSQCLKQEKIGMPELYSLLLQALTVLDDSKQYMLSQDNFFMDENHIFVEESLAAGTLHFAYLPVTDRFTEEPLAKKLIALITKMMTSVTVIEGNGIQQLLRFCSDELFSVAEMKKLLLRLLLDDKPAKSESNMVAGKRLVQQPLPASVTIREYMPPHSPSSAGVNINPPSFLARGKEQFKLPTELDDNEQQVGETGENEETGSTSKTTYIMLGALLVIAMIWKLLYFDHPGSFSLMICLALTLLIAVFAMLIWKGKWSIPGRFKLSGKQHDSEELELSDKREDLLLEKGWRWNEPNEPLNNLTGIPPVQEDRYAPPAVEPAVNFAPVPQPKTVLLSRRTAHGSEPDMSSSSEPSFSLDRMGPGEDRAESIPLSPGSFVIGRSEEMVQYVDRTAGVSRAHVELMIRAGECSLKDLGSRNGTRLGGEVIAPYKEYSLNPGDSFMIAECTYTLRKSGRQSL